MKEFPHLLGEDSNFVSSVVQALTEVQAKLAFYYELVAKAEGKYTLAQIVTSF